MKRQERVPMIDALRGLSCLGILLYHVRVDLWIGWWRIRSYPDEYSAFAKATAWLSIPTPFLGYAILLFFLISGFCIHYPNTVENRKPKWGQYFIRRFWRIYPPYLAALVLTGGISYFCHIHWNDSTWDTGRILRTATLSQNYPPGNGQFLSNPSLWTIPLEVEFYMLYPFAFCLFSRLRSSLLALFAMGLFAWTVFLGKQGVSWPSFTALFFWPVWLLGAWTAQLYRGNRLKSMPSWLLVLTGAISLALASHKHMQDWDIWLQYLLWTGFYLSLLLLSISKQNFINSLPLQGVLSLLTWLGKISFSLYLVHFPLFKLLGYLHVAQFGGKPVNFLLSLGYLFLVCLFGWVFYYWIERPIHLWSKNRLQKS
jgi:peptidoglycan/LPS O-acetylase OafA/YrhL